MKIRWFGRFLLLAAAAMLLAGTPVVAAEKAMKEKKPTHTELRNAMRMLWEDHVHYTQAFIVASLAGLEDAGPLAERLLRNQDDIGNAVKPFYGEEAGKKLSALLRDHILIAADLVKAAKAGDNDGVGKNRKRWDANADEIVAFLNGANPKNWPAPVLKDMLYKHLDYTSTNVVSRLKKDWAAAIQAYDAGHAHMLMFADALSDGIIKQFPKKFK
ncbi:MAG TPA: glycosyltransferase [bacterium]